MKKTNRTRAYNERNYERLTVYLPRGRREQVKEALRAMGTTPNAWINDLLRAVCGVAPDDWKLPLPVEDEAEDAQ